MCRTLILLFVNISFITTSFFPNRAKLWKSYRTKVPQNQLVEIPQRRVVGSGDIYFRTEPCPHLTMLSCRMASRRRFSEVEHHAPWRSGSDPRWLHRVSNSRV